MNAIATNHSYFRHQAAGLIRKLGFGRVLITGSLLCAITFGISSLSKSEPPTPVESLYAEAVRPSSARLKSAREAEKRCEHELAIHDYLVSIQEDTSTADVAIGEIVTVCLSVAQAQGTDGHCVDRSAQINRCSQMLSQLRQADSTARTLPEVARKRLFKEIEHVRSAGKDVAQSHIDAANQLREDAKGKHWWSFNDQDKQMDALHQVNLAWSYYPAHCDENMVHEMYKIWADMKGNLATWRYNQVMEQDRLQLGRVVGDR